MQELGRMIKKLCSKLFSRIVITGVLILIQAAWFWSLFTSLSSYAHWLNPLMIALSVIMCAVLIRQDSTAPEFKISWMVLFMIMPVQGGFNPDRPQMLMPAKLGPLTRLAKLAEQDADAAVLVLGHADSSGVAEQNLKLSEQRAAAVASIFRLSGLQRDRMLLKGMGSNMPRAANDSAAGRELNRRVEIILTPKNTLVALMNFYSQPAQPTLVADQSSKPKAN